MTALNNPVFSVIMAGGSGTRFWPLSRRKHPKQFLPLATSKPLLVESARRLSNIASAQKTLVVCGKIHASTTKKLLKALPVGNILIEPEARNTAPAIGLATAHVHRRAPQGILVVMPSDQHVADTTAFEQALRQACDAANQGAIVTLGIKPTRPETGYGYIQVGETLFGAARKISRFVEKPDLPTAQRYLSQGNYLWNGGIFVFRADVMLEAFRQWMPELFAVCASIEKSIGTKKYGAVLKKEFPKAPAISIDYGVAEKANNMAVVPCDCGWNDVGSFNALPDVRTPDAAGNTLEGKMAMAIDCAGCVVWSSGRPVALVGMKDVVVVDSGDAVLVVPKEKSQEVRKVVAALTSQKSTKYL